jgi:hypothetical protein
MTRDRSGGDADNAGFMKEGEKGDGGQGDRQDDASQSGGQDGDDRRGPAELQGQRDQASGRRDEENLATRSDADVTDRQSKDIGPST